MSENKQTCHKCDLIYAMLLEFRDRMVDCEKRWRENPNQFYAMKEILNHIYDMKDDIEFALKDIKT